MLFKSEPSPLNEPLNEPVNSSAVIFFASNDSDTNTEPLNSDFTDSDANTLNTPSVETDAVTEPVVIKFDKSASSTKAERGILNKFSPLPEKNEPLFTSMFPLTNNEPLNSDVTEPVPNTLKNPASSIDAVTEPLVIKFDKSASSTNAVFGILNNPSPLPVKKEPLLS